MNYTHAHAQRGLVSISNVTSVNKLQLHKLRILNYQIVDQCAYHIRTSPPVQLEFHGKNKIVFDFIRTVNAHCSLVISRALDSRLFTERYSNTVCIDSAMCLSFGAGSHPNSVFVFSAFLMWWDAHLEWLSLFYITHSTQLHRFASTLMLIVKNWIPFLSFFVPCTPRFSFREIFHVWN